MPVIERRPLLQSIVVFWLALLMGALVVLHLQRLAVAERRQAARDLARASAFAIEQRFSIALSSAQTMAGLVAERATEPQLDAVARRLVELGGGTLSLQLARGCVISHIWPLEGNEAARGLDLLGSPVHGSFIRSVIAGRAPLVYGPFELVQGGAGLALRVPVHVREGGRERAWGLASVIMRVRILLTESRMDRLADAGLEYSLVRAGGDGRVGERVASSRADGTALEEPVSVPVELPGQTWTLAVAPAGGWIAWGAAGGVIPLGVLLIALLAAGLAYRVLALPFLLRREVAARTRELEVAHAEQRRAEDAQRQSQKLESIGLLAGGVAHDFNNLLVGILGYADVLAAEAAPGSVTEEAARTITQAAQRAAGLTRQLLALARLGQHRRERVDVHAMVEEAVGLLGRTLDKSIRLETRLGAPEHDVLGEPGQLQQVIVNLAVNARDAMPEGGVLTIETAAETFDAQSAPPGLPPGPYLTLAVTDTGVGIPAAIQERIFEPFFTTKSEGQGSGLGLATVFGIAKGHGGTVRVYSEPGKGARFLVHLPLLQGREVGAAPRGAGVVLVVDDEELVRRTASRILASLGYEPVQVPGGQEALDWLARQAAPPVAVILDLAMPGMDGRTCFRELHARHPGLRVIVSSGFSKNDRAEELLAEGAAGFVQKPYRTAELARALAGRAEGPQRVL
jgi:signal transduction histidine kinase/ActR/RegA family two-component response regulator